MPRRILLTTLLVAAVSGGALAQSTGQRITIERGAPAAARQEGSVRVQLNMHMFIAGPTDDSEEAEKGRARSRQAFYDLAAKECDVLRDTIANTCHLQNININLTRQSQQNMQGYNVNASMAFQITLK